MSSTNLTATRPNQHVKVRNAEHVYKSQRSDGSWRYEIRHPVEKLANGKTRRRFETLVEGTTLAQAKQRAREAHGKNAPKLASLTTTFGDVVEDWRQIRTLRPGSVERYDMALRDHILPFFAHRRVREINKSHVRAWLFQLRRKDGREGDLAEGSKCFVLAVFAVIMKHAVDMEAIAAVPKLDRRQKPKATSRVRFLSLVEEVLLFDMFEKRRRWMRPIITVALNQGMRLGEILGLRWTDVDFGAGKITVRRTLHDDGSFGPTKGGKERTIDLMPGAREALLDLRVLDPDSDGLIFTNTLGGQRQLRDVQRAFTQAVRKAGLSNEHGPVVFHTLRHTCGSRLMNHPGVTAVYVRDFLGHASLLQTDKYTHKIENESVTQAAVRALSGVAS